MCDLFRFFLPTPKLTGDRKTQKREKEGAKVIESERNTIWSGVRLAKCKSGKADRGRLGVDFRIPFDQRNKIHREPPPFFFSFL